MLGHMSTNPLLISEIQKHAERHHSHVEVFSRMGDGSIKETTWGKVFDRSKQVANALKNLGLVQGDRVATLAWNTSNHLEVYFGISSSGLVLHTINPRLFPDQITYIANHGGAKAIILDEDFAPVVDQIADELTECEHFIIFSNKAGQPPKSKVALKDYEAWIADEPSSFDWPNLDENSASSLCYTSGTTGNPKGVLYSHRATVLHSLSVSTPNVMGFSTDSSILPVVPMFHVNAWGTPYAAAMNGSKFVLPGNGMDGGSLVEMVKIGKVSHMLGVPTVWLGLLNYCEEQNIVLETPQSVFVGGTAAPKVMIERFDKIHNIKLMHLWGMTEMTPMGTVNDYSPEVRAMPEEERYDYLTKQGRPPYGVTIKIVDDEGKELPHDGVAFGRLLVRGIWILDQYYKQEEKAVDADGFFDTGDVATIDARGLMKIVDRAKDVIKSGGEWISSIELENIAVGIPGVAEACVIGVAHERWDERPLLLLVLTPGSEVSRDQALAFLSDKVAKFWLPDDVLTVDELPHTATGKLLKTTLRQQYADHLLNG